MEKDLLLQRAALSRPSGQCNNDDFDVVANGETVGRIFKAGVSVARPWIWTLMFPHHGTPPHGYAVTREAAMAAFAKSLRRE